MLEDKLKDWFDLKTFKPGQRHYTKRLRRQAYIRHTSNWQWEKFMLSIPNISYRKANASHLTTYFTDG